METLLGLSLNAVSGIAAAIVVGIVFRTCSLGILGNILAGVIGGVAGGAALDAVAYPGILGMPGEVLAGGAVGGVLALGLGIIRRNQQPAPNS